MEKKDKKQRERDHIEIVKKAIRMAGEGTMVTIEFDHGKKEGPLKNAGKRI
ncbi:MAG: hypothetical protein J6L93_06750 [Butyrivibrio sp.]|nr:hypothetical protein [Butyrivibrio sp.]MBQ4454736.1 hypothetical protein [Clostridia bacterium]